MTWVDTPMPALRVRAGQPPPEPVMRKCPYFGRAIKFGLAPLNITLAPHYKAKHTHFIALHPNSAWLMSPLRAAAVPP